VQDLGSTACQTVMLTRVLLANWTQEQQLRQSGSLATYFLTLYTFLVRRTLEERLRQQYAVTDLTGFYESAAFRTSGFKLEAADILAERRITYAE